MSDVSTGKEISKLASEKFTSGESVVSLPADTGSVPQAQNACEGNDCIGYDFPMGMSVKGGPR